LQSVLTGFSHAAQAALGNPGAYIGSFPYEFAAGTYNIDPSFDPATSNPTGKPCSKGIQLCIVGRSVLQCMAFVLSVATDRLNGSITRL